MSSADIKLKKETPKTGKSGSSSQRRETRQLRDVGVNSPSWRKHDLSVSPLPPEQKVSQNYKFKKSKDPHVPFFITVMGKDGKLLLNVVPDKKRRKEVQIFYNKGRSDDGLQVVRSCLRNMLSIDFEKIIAVNVYKGYYLAIQTNHTNHNTRWYHTDPRYKSNIGILEYVSLDDINEFANECNATIGPKIVNYFDEVSNYIHICQEIASEFT